jgi:hypothetical protein
MIHINQIFSKYKMNAHQINQTDADWLHIVRQHIEPLHYGSVEITVHDSRIVQIDKTERWRLQKNSLARRSQFSNATRSAPRR